MDLNLTNKRALVLGSSAGIGRAIAAALIAEGAQVALASRDEARLAEAARALGARLTLRCDLREAGAATHAVERARRGLEGLDIVVCNTGGPPKGGVSQIDTAQWHESFQSLLMSVVEVARAAAPTMQAQRFGRILVVSSTSAREPLPAMALSNTLRAGLAGLLRTLSDELAPSGVTVNALLPGYMDTERLRQLGVTAEKVAGVVPAGRMGHPEELASLAAFLASERAAYVCGQAIAVDGGRLRGL